ncbi:hypothetical protein [Naasia sp. SYSU D00948]|uniref:hypothetical protein n=1 Tax=Naasia sp. SYSU D00948 TaxID=2817379 RepID=UPI001B307DD2|nr:hypothetical protein [Naasia sp. SYSU D00948]
MRWTRPVAAGAAVALAVLVPALPAQAAAPIRETFVETFDDALPCPDQTYQVHGTLEQESWLWIEGDLARQHSKFVVTQTFVDETGAVVATGTSHAGLKQVHVHVPEEGSIEFTIISQGAYFLRSAAGGVLAKDVGVIGATYRVYQDGFDIVRQWMGGQHLGVDFDVCAVLEEAAA